MLINPASDDPWDSLFFSPATGLISPRIVSVYNGVTQIDRKGGQTLETLGAIINGDPAMSGRKRNWTRIMARVSEYFEGAHGDVGNRGDLFADIDDYGLAEWLLAREGKEVKEMKEMRLAEPDRWRVLRDLPRY